MTRNINSEGETRRKVFPLPTVAALPASPFHGASARCIKQTRLGEITPRGGSTELAEVKPRGIIKTVIFFALVVLFGTTAVCEAVTDADRMNEGNAAYRAGNWSLAVKKYSGITVKNADLFYNRAGAHFKNGQVGKAIVYYNRALRIKPRESDIRKNLEHVRFSRADKIETEKKPRAVKVVETAYRALSMNEHAAISIALFTVLSALLFGVVTLGDGKTRTRLKNLAAAAATLLAIEAAITGIKTYSEAVTASGVVIVKTATALDSPSAGERVFVLHDGAEVILGRRENGFIQLKLQTGWTGWLPENAVEKI